ncbi:C2 domain-containing protein, partial [Syncephalis pseudoplumigaleata]
LGTLEVRPIAGRELKEKDLISKQDPYLEVTCGSEKHATKADKRGGRKPQWSDVLRYDIHEGSNQMFVKAFAAGLNESKFIGECMIELKRVFSERQFDSWFELKDRGKYAGEIYLELTFY